MKQKLTTDRISVHSLTVNHLKIILMGLEFDFSYGELFALTFLNSKKERQILCKHIKKGQERVQGYHYSTLEPVHKNRLSALVWKKQVNTICSKFNLEIPKISKISKNRH